FDFRNPSASIPKLVQAYKLIQNLENDHWREIKLVEIKEIIAQSAGLYLEAVAASQMATPGEIINLEIEAINRSNSDIELVSISHLGNKTLPQNSKLTNNKELRIKDSITISNDAEYTTPYWLASPGTLGMYKVKDSKLIGKPETPRQYRVTFNLMVNGTPIDFHRPIVYKTNDPVDGEIYKPFDIVPKASSRILQDMVVFNSNEPKEITVAVKSGIDNLKGNVSLAYPSSWVVSPDKQAVDISSKGEEQLVTFTITPPSSQEEGIVSPIVEVGNKKFDRQLVEIDYDHIPFQNVLLPNTSRIVKIDLKRAGENIGYIDGAGDVVPESLRNIGYNVVPLDYQNLTLEKLEEFDAVILGIRAYNVLDGIQFKQPLLFEYVKNGGNLIVQYNTSRGLNVDTLAPYSLELSRDRVTDEESEVKFLSPGHEVLNYPNKITQKDFDGWVQERGLYFPDKWSEEFTPILSMNDVGETPKKGSLLVAKYGEGYYVYTGLSFFREFPAGVPGAYRLFANLIALGKNQSSSSKIQGN
ncbi:MAG: LmbE family protein, partial [Flavobacteriaceae bacterium]|nr:LmbE family protein [Flavobacteriaceae bacterium]